jgi:uncharacterized protein YdhG (YjbR/CyaY superfamily)
VSDTHRLSRVLRPKKANALARGSAAEGNVAPKNTDEYLALVPEPARGTLTKVRAAIRSAAPLGATEAISYRVPTFRYKGALLGFAAFPNHCSLFPMSPSVIVASKKELKDFHTSKAPSASLRTSRCRPLL